MLRYTDNAAHLGEWETHPVF